MITLDRSAIHSDPEIMGGTIVFRGTRVPAQTILDCLDRGGTLAEFFAAFPTVSRQDAVAFLKLVREG